MAIKVDGIQQIRTLLEKEANKCLEKVVALLQYVGETVVNGIRDGSMSNWIDQTGNLRSSVGYLVTVDGKPHKKGGFVNRMTSAKGSDEGGNGSGSDIGASYARQCASLHPNGIALIIVAGMDYASYVEGKDNKTVLARGEIEAENLAKELVEQLNGRREKL